MQRLIEGDTYSKSNIFDSKVDEKRRLANTLYQEFVRAKERYSDYFELSNIVYSEREYSYVLMYVCSNFIVLFLLASNNRPI